MDRLIQAPDQHAGAVPTSRSIAREDGDPGYPGSSTPRHVLIYSRHPLMEAGVAYAIMTKWPTARVVLVQSFAEVQSSLAGGHIDLLVVHLSHTGAAQRAVLESVRISHPKTKVLVVAPEDDRDAVLSCLAARAHGVVVPSVTPSELLRAIQTVMAGCVHVPTMLAVLSVSSELRTLTSAPDCVLLTPRQTQVLRLLAEGRSNKDIANRLGLGVGTVKVHMAHLFAALGARSRIEVVVKSRAAQQRTLEAAPWHT